MDVVGDVGDGEVEDAAYSTDERDTGVRGARVVIDVVVVAFVVVGIARLLSLSNRA